MTLTDLISRLESAEGPDRELDAAIAVRMGVAPRYEGDGVYGCPRYTAKIDAALTLVPEGWVWGRDVGGGIVLMEDPWDEAEERHQGTAFSEATSPALSVCAAALRARAEGKKPRPRR